MIEPEESRVAGYSFVFPVAVYEGEKGRLANAVLVDKQQGIFLTPAHVVAAGTELMVCLEKGVEDVLRHRKWINWKADIACFRLPEEHLGQLAAINQAVFYDPPPEEKRKMKYRDVRVAGFHETEDSITRFQRDCIIHDYQSGFGITYPTYNEKERLKSRWFVAKEDKSKLYEKYICVLSLHESFLPTMSGSVLLIDDRPLGILVRGGEIGLAVPSEEINRLLKKIQSTS